MHAGTTVGDRTVTWGGDVRARVIVSSAVMKAFRWAWVAILAACAAPRAMEGTPLRRTGARSVARDSAPELTLHADVHIEVVRRFDATGGSLLVTERF